MPVAGFAGQSVDVVILNNAEPMLVHQVFRYGVLLRVLKQDLVEFRRLNFYRYLDQIRISRILFEKNKKRIRSRSRWLTITLSSKK